MGRDDDRAFGSIQRPMFDTAFVRAWFARYWLAVWFAIIFVMRFSVVITGNIGFDAELYLAATRAWMSGDEPWVVIQQQQFAAPPPTLLPLVPLLILPPQAGAAVLIGVAAFGVVATVRLLRLPWWWILFPPFIDAVVSGNPQAVLVPLILVGAGPLAAFLKIYALVPMVLGLRWRAVAITLAALAVTAPFLPWVSYLERSGELAASLVRQSDGGMSATSMPWLIPVAAVLLVLCGRQRAAWLAVPVIWPSTQWYYSTLAVPAVVASPIAAAILAIPIQGVPVLAAAVVAWQSRPFSIDRLRQAWAPGAPEPGSKFAS